MKRGEKLKYADSDSTSDAKTIFGTNKSFDNFMWESRGKTSHIDRWGRVQVDLCCGDRATCIVAYVRDTQAMLVQLPNTFQPRITARYAPLNVQRILSQTGRRMAFAPTKSHADVGLNALQKRL